MELPTAKKDLLFLKIMMLPQSGLRVQRIGILHLKKRTQWKKMKPMYTIILKKGSFDVALPASLFFFIYVLLLGIIGFVYSSFLIFR